MYGGHPPPHHGTHGAYHPSPGHYGPPVHTSQHQVPPHPHIGYGHPGYQVPPQLSVHPQYHGRALPGHHAEPHRHHPQHGAYPPPHGHALPSHPSGPFVHQPHQGAMPHGYSSASGNPTHHHWHPLPHDHPPQNHAHHGVPLPQHGPPPGHPHGYGSAHAYPPSVSHIPRPANTDLPSPPVPAGGTQKSRRQGAIREKRAREDNSENAAAGTSQLRALPAPEGPTTVGNIQSSPRIVAPPAKRQRTDCTNRQRTDCIQQSSAGHHSVDGVLSAARKVQFDFAMAQMGQADAQGDWVVVTARGWQCIQGLMEGDENEPGHSDIRLRLGAEAAGMPNIPTHLDPKFAQNLYRRGQYLAHYLYVSDFPEFDPEAGKNFDGEDLPKVLMVAEKPSIARIMAEHLSNGRCRAIKGISRACQVWQFIAYCPTIGSKAKILVTSTLGHVFGLTFTQQKGDPELLFDKPVTKEAEETTVKMRIIEHLKELASGCQYLLLWLDCDREGENICYEVISVCREHFPSDEKIYRAKFSALTEQEIRHAFQNMGRPNAHMAMAVDARQELDLRIGVAFTRFLTRQFLDKAKEKFPKADLKVLSYGPCQTPTLWFCVQRHWEILRFHAQDFWKPVLRVEVGGLAGSIEASREHEQIYDYNHACHVLRLMQSYPAVVMRQEIENKTARRPVGLNTVALLKAGSTGLGISPGSVMKAAENLYSAGYISYPRTESSRYPPSFDVTAVLQEQVQHPEWGNLANRLLQVSGGRLHPPAHGHDAGDHPPITPTRYATKSELTKVKEWRIYEHVCRNFLASLLPDVQYEEHTLRLSIGGDPFYARWHVIHERGFLSATPWKQKDLRLVEVGPEKRQAGVPPVPFQHPGMQLRIWNPQLERDRTKPPEYLKESELIDLMDKHKIGTDASMAGHIENVVARNYVAVCGPSGQPGRPGVRIVDKPGKGGSRGKGKGKGGGEQPKSRHMVPTGLGIAVLETFQRLAPDLCEPAVRAFMERQVAQIADGQCSLQDVIRTNIADFRQRFRVFRHGIPSVEHIFAPTHVPGPVWDGQDWSHTAWPESGQSSSRAGRGRGGSKKSAVLKFGRGKKRKRNA